MIKLYVGGYSIVVNTILWFIEEKTKKANLALTKVSFTLLCICIYRTMVFKPSNILNKPPTTHQIWVWQRFESHCCSHMKTHQNHFMNIVRGTQYRNEFSWFKCILGCIIVYNNDPFVDTPNFKQTMNNICAFAIIKATHDMENAIGAIKYI